MVNVASCSYVFLMEYSWVNKELVGRDFQIIELMEVYQLNQEFSEENQGEQERKEFDKQVTYFCLMSASLPYSLLSVDLYVLPWKNWKIETLCVQKCCAWSFIID